MIFLIAAMRISVECGTHERWAGNTKYFNLHLKHTRVNIG